MISVDDFDGLSVGDLIETVPLFPALSPDPVLLRTATKAHDRAEFLVTYHGVTLGRWSVAKDAKGGLTWARG